MPDPKPQQWADREYTDNDVQRIISYVSSRASKHFGAATDSAITYDKERMAYRVRLCPAPHTVELKSFIAAMERTFNRNADARSNIHPAGMRSVYTFPPVTLEAANSFEIRGNPRRLFAQILVNTPDTFPWDSFTGRGR